MLRVRVQTAAIVLLIGTVVAAPFRSFGVLAGQPHSASAANHLNVRSAKRLRSTGVFLPRLASAAATANGSGNAARSRSTPWLATGSAQTASPRLIVLRSLAGASVFPLRC